MKPIYSAVNICQPVVEGEESVRETRVLHVDDDPEQSRFLKIFL
jgi:hypothetical protein